ncbi:hypothetical protein PIB30_050544 [Stylosanthes scabra]|uniref:Uncharacterized protein n=1 Tax=Stylosanthes scabra TaxID=79078 RepID=A0ABU6XI53_9FABA|nr:hypothetical protein [Stylosanthes scabra]
MGDENMTAGTVQNAENYSPPPPLDKIRVEIAGVLGGLDAGEPVFVPQVIEERAMLGQHAFTVILPKSAPGLDVVAYGPVAGDEATTRRDAAMMLLKKLLTVTLGKLCNLEIENDGLKKCLGL